MNLHQTPPLSGLIRAHDNANRPIVTEAAITGLIHFNLVRLARGERFETALPNHEAMLVVLSGTADMGVDGVVFESVGRRADIWSGPADSVYAPRAARIMITGVAETTEIAIAGGLCEARHPPFRVTPDEVDMVEVGSVETHSRRRIFHILGQNGAGRAGNLLVSELYADPGCWSGYPPHKHDSDCAGESGVLETNHEEVYHYRFDPPSGFGAQITYRDGRDSTVMTRHGDTFLLDRGYHPTVTSPGHRGYIFTILVGETQRGLVQAFDPEHAHLMSVIPGVDAMRAKFK